MVTGATNNIKEIKTVKNEAYSGNDYDIDQIIQDHVQEEDEEADCV